MDEILKELCKRVGGIHEHNTSEAKKSILNLFREMVPLETTMNHKIFDEGFNTCRMEILLNIDNLEKGSDERAAY